MAHVIVALLAQFDEGYIARDLAKKAGSRVATKVAARFQNLYARLGHHPEIGVLRPSLGKHARIGFVAPYTLAYEYDSATNTVIILPIIHGRRELTAAMLFSSPGS